MSELTEWGSFYVIVGSSGGALIGLQFVVMTLISERPPLHAPEAGAAFATPNIIHFGVALLLSAVGSMPWRGFSAISFSWGLVGLCGIAYSLIVLRRLRSQTTYKPVFEDWLFHVLLPFLAYTVVTASAFIAHSHSRRALFLVGAATLLLLFIGIHNAWDAVTYFVYIKKGE